MCYVGLQIGLFQHSNFKHPQIKQCSRLHKVLLFFICQGKIIHNLNFKIEYSKVNYDVKAVLYTSSSEVKCQNRSVVFKEEKNWGKNRKLFSQILFVASSSNELDLMF